ncbi:glycosyltransferase family 4 protein [Silvibacterium acidisoli]|uniref:glycosyltransferase family 4 protein n=1 Tax=Acidobacteriaceae bacterium ZG23-2 TaxID=2883246 RepID=UPI00406CD1D1
MQVVQAVNGVFHHFDLARELESRGYLKRIYSTFPWKRLQREGLPSDKVRRFPWIQPPLMVAGRFRQLPVSLSRNLQYANFRLFDNWIAKQIEECDAFVALSGSGLKTGSVVQGRGGKYLCDRGSSHIRYQDSILNDEYARWGFSFQACDPRMIDREEAEYAKADAITIASEFARRSFVAMGVPAEKIYKIAYGVRLDRFARTADPSRDTFEVLFAGQVSVRKGIAYLVEAFQKVRHPKKKLRLVGSADSRMRELLNRMDLTDVEVVGSVPQPKLAEYMNTSHVLVLPSIEDGFGLVMAQAMACGCPVIASENSGGPDLVTDGVDGFVVPIRSVDAIAGYLEQIAGDWDLQQRMREAALRKVRSFGGWSDYGQQYSDLLLKLTGEA